MERTRTYQTHQVIKCNAGKNASERKAVVEMCNDLSNTVQNVGKGCMEGKDLGEDPGYQGLAEQSLVTRIVPKPVGAW